MPQYLVPDDTQKKLYKKHKWQIKADTETPQALSPPEKTKYNYSERKWTIHTKTDNDNKKWDLYIPYKWHCKQTTTSITNLKTWSHKW